MQPITHAPAYIPELDGLRAFAILSVLFFHFGVPGFDGGFIGVDVFFVISGFLIGRGIKADIDNQTFSLSGYYIRRFKRIYPALLLMLLCVVSVGALALRPFDVVALAKATIFAAFGAGNIHFARIAENYFAEDVNRVAVLHTWSLGVEEQFYILLPLIYLALAKLRQKTSFKACIFYGLIIVSFIVCQYLLTANSILAFYGLPSRAWELLLGVVAGHSPFLVNRKYRPLFALAGFSLILVAVFSLTQSSPFPGLNALLPVLGTVLTIIGGSAGVGCALTRSPVVAIGKMSYSLYLWHWPILVFGQDPRLSPDFAGDLAYFSPLQRKVILFVLTFAIAFLSLKYIETPFRRLQGKSAARLALFLALLLGGISLSCRYLRKNDGFLMPPPEEIREILAYSRDTNPFLRQAFDKHVPPEKAFVYGDSTATPSFVLWGDSHANAIAFEFGEAAKQKGLSIRFFGRGGTKPIPALYAGFGAAEKRKRDYLDKALQCILNDKHVHTVVLCARWLGYRKGSQGTSVDGHTIPTAKVKVGNREVRLDEFLESNLGNLVETLNHAGKRVILLYPIPEIGVHVPQLVASQKLRPDEKWNIPTHQEFLNDQEPVFSAFNRLKPGPGLVRLQPHSYFSDGKQIIYADGSKPLYQDDNHLNLTGSRRLRPLFDIILDSNASDSPYQVRTTTK
jgi:peptidoglycan/LPS O-acetylase OafA/YrhL